MESPFIFKVPMRQAMRDALDTVVSMVASGVLYREASAFRTRYTRVLDSSVFGRYVR